jgi:hypothetical protein
MYWKEPEHVTTEMLIAIRKFEECSGIKVLADLVLCDFLLQDFAFMPLENLHNLSNLSKNCWLNVI